MMDYSKLSDQEINLVIIEKYKVQLTAFDYVYDPFNPIDYCNSWGDAGKIIAEHFIQLNPRVSSCCEECSDSYYTGNWEASYFDTSANKYFFYEDENPLRAAMIVFLMMNEE